MKINGFSIGNLYVQVPIVQGGMGVGISLGNLASAVASNGGIGVIAAAQIGYNCEGFEQNPIKTNLAALGNQFKIARQKAKGGIIGVNIMCATRSYQDYVKCCVENKADIIISGAGLPVNLPELVMDSETKIAPIISSHKAAKVLLNLWDKRYRRTADLIIVEGSKAGGHLGFTKKEAELTPDFEDELKSILQCVSTYESKYNRKIPIVFGGGIFSSDDVRHYLGIGCQGVQVGSRFVVTEECDAHENFKLAYIKSRKDDIGIINSPVGMPGRAILNSFIKRICTDREDVKKCYLCINNCDPKTTPYCISKALINSVNGDIDNGLIFCGAETYRINAMTTVKNLMNELLNFDYCCYS